MSKASLATLGSQYVLDSPDSEGRTVSDGRALFRWSNGNKSSSVAADEVTLGEGDGGRWVAPGSDKTGASGAWEWVPSGPAFPGLYAEDSGADNTDELNKWLENNVSIVGDGETYDHSGTLYAKGKQQYFAAGTTFNYTGTGGVAFQFSGGVSHCRYFGLRVEAGDARIGVSFTTNIQGGGSGNCNFNEIHGAFIRGTNRSVSKPTFAALQADITPSGPTQGVRFDNQADHATAYVVYFNKILSGVVDRFDVSVNFRDSDPPDHVSAANANHITDVDVQNAWYGFMFGGLENVVRGGYFSSSSGTDASELFTGYYFGPSSFGNDVTGASGEPGEYAQIAYCEAGSNLNEIDLPIGRNYTHGFEDFGTSNTISTPSGHIWQKDVVGLTENTYYKIKIGVPKVGKAAVCDINWDSLNASTNSRAAGGMRFAVRASATGDLTASVTSNTIDISTGSGYTKPAGLEITDNGDDPDDLYLVVFVTDNLSATSASRFNYTITEPLGGDALNRQESTTTAPTIT